MLVTLPTVRLCTVLNTLGTCGCQPQLFVENTCKRAFYCTEVPDTVENGADYDGCAVECQDDEILIADPR